MTFTPDGKYLIMRRANFQVFDADTGELVFENAADITGGFGIISISPTGKYLFTDYIESSHAVTTLWKIDQKQ
jgi:VCBS repeat-containing protein